MPDFNRGRAAEERRTTRRPLVLIALLLAMFMAAIEGTIVATAMPSIATDLNGFSLYSWVFSAYLLTQAVTIPIFGKLADLFGRKRVFSIGIVIFLVGSILCGLAPTMGALVGFRLLQGIGAGAVQPLTITLAGDLYSLPERGKIQGFMSAVWGVSAIAGPLTGGLIVQYGHWPWIFWMNIPFGLLSIALVGLFLHERLERKDHSIDYLGAALFLVGLGALMLALTQSADWGGGLLTGLVVLAVVVLLLFVRQQARAAEPMMPLEIWRHSLIPRANAATLTAGVIMMGVIAFVPTFVQGVLGGSALTAGFSLSAMSLGWPLAATIAGRLLVPWGTHITSRIGGVAILLGSLMLAVLGRHGPLAVGSSSFMVGVGLGFLNTTFIVAVQSSVDWQQRGVATASNMLMRFMGNALGAAIFGGVLNFSLQHYLAERGLAGQVSADSVQNLLDETGRQATELSAPVMAALQSGLGQSLQLVFWGVVVFAVATALVSWRVPRLQSKS